MDRVADRYRYILERPVVEVPGLHWTYNGGATALVARLIAKGTRRPLEDFAREVLFEPLGITRTEWERGRDGDVLAASGLEFRSATWRGIGLMVLAGGRWHGRQADAGPMACGLFFAPARVDAGLAAEQAETRQITRRSVKDVSWIDQSGPPDISGTSPDRSPAFRSERRSDERILRDRRAHSVLVDRSKRIEALHGPMIYETPVDNER